MPFQILPDHSLPTSHTLLPTIEEKDSLKVNIILYIYILSEDAVTYIPHSM
jgi:hypothetical protein